VTIQPIRVWGDPVLRGRATEVTTFDNALRSLIVDLFETMYDAPGVGLAAPQIGVDLQVFVYDVDGVVGHVVNPSLTVSAESQRGSEGCLSVPGLRYERRRARHAQVTGFDQDGAPVYAAATGLLARCFQHETDHLDGEIYVDGLARADKMHALRAIRDADLVNSSA